VATSTDLRAAIEEVQNQLPADQLEGGLEAAYEADWATRVEQRVGALPWWVISAVVHSVIFLLATLIGVAMPPPQVDEVSIVSDMAQKKEPEYDEKKKRDLFKNPNEVKHEKQVENPVVVHEKAEITDHFETENDMDNQTARGHEDAISDIPLGGTGVTGVMGVGGGGMAGCFGYRDGGGRKRAVARFGGSPATESAVEAALRWLARHQEADGHWDTRKLEASQRYDVGVTGLAALAFLGAGHTEKAGKYRDNVRRAVAWLIKQQQDDGAIGNSRSHKFGYEHAIAGLALAEAYGMAKNPATRTAAQKAVDWTIHKHQVPYGGWRYRAREAGDTSVTGWFIMQLKSAKVAGLKVDHGAFQGATKFLDGVTRPDGRSSYMKGRGPTHIMTSVAVVGRQFMGVRNSDPLLQKAADYMLRVRVPKWQSSGYGTFYYWYYGTLGMFQMGGERWKKWNKELKPVLLDNQRKGGDEDGSWDLLGGLDKRAGRAYTTAMGALSLEVYYRYLPMYSK
jgi:hypothetical protein